jgi:hypothetical protein
MPLTKYTVTIRGMRQYTWEQMLSESQNLSWPPFTPMLCGHGAVPTEGRNVHLLRVSTSQANSMNVWKIRTVPHES